MQDQNLNVLERLAQGIKDQFFSGGQTSSEPPSNRASMRAAAKYAGGHTAGFNHRKMKAHRPACSACKTEKAGPYSHLCGTCKIHSELSHQHLELERARRAEVNAAEVARLNEIRAAREAQTQAEGYVCEDCGKPYKTRQALAAHSRVHSARPAARICPECGRGFETPQGLSAHARAHLVRADR